MSAENFDASSASAAATITAIFAQAVAESSLTLIQEAPVMAGGVAYIICLGPDGDLIDALEASEPAEDSACAEWFSKLAEFFESRAKTMRETAATLELSASGASTQ